MKIAFAAIVLLSLALACGPASEDSTRSQAASGADSAQQGTAPAPAAPETHAPPQRAPTDAAATVNGASILEQELDERIAAVVSQQTQGRGLPPEQLAHAHAVLRPELLERLVDERLLDQDAEKHGIGADAAELREKLDVNVRAYLLANNMSQEDLEKRIQTIESKSLEQYLEAQTSDPAFRRSVVHTKLLEEVYPEQTAVTEEEVAARYETGREARYTRPEMVRASHILIVPQSPAPEEEEAARKRAEDVLALARAPGADFAALAREHSDDPSSSLGGDLGFFPRENAMVEPFAAAAFALDAGEVGDVVRTPFGFHVIQVTAKEAARVATLEELSETIRQEILGERIADVRKQHVQVLREAAAIAYGS